MKQPLFSIVIPCLNEEKFLPHVLSSLADQTYRDFEVIVVDGGSKDASVQVARSFSKSLPSVHVVQAARANQSFQRNIGASKTAGAYLVFVDADSVLMPYALSRMAAFVRETKSKFFTAWTRPDGETTEDTTIALLANMFIEGSILVKRSVAPGAFMAVEKQLFLTCGGFKTSLTFGEDFDLVSRVVALGTRLDVLRETLYAYSLRRIKREGKLKFFRTYSAATLVGLLANRAVGKVPDYPMGGHVYTRAQKRRTASLLAKWEKKIKVFAKELLAT